MQTTHLNDGLRIQHRTLASLVGLLEQLADDIAMLIARANITIL